jgi:signal transduction histidine kinase
LQTDELKKQSFTLQQQSELLQTNNEELNKLNATKDKFFSIIAHDLRNPFNTILGFTELLETKFDKLEENKKKNYIKNIKNTANRTYNLLENLLLWSRLQTDRLEFTPENILAIEYLNEVLVQYEPICSEKRLEIYNQVDEKCVVFADKTIVSIILKNLISNAIKYNSPGGSVFINYHIHNNLVQFDITDTGIGMDNSQIQNLFRLDKSRKTAGTGGEVGTGLGLILCFECVKKNGGELWAKSKEGEGSTFSFTVPKANL